MNCPNCGFELKEGMRFCGKCGSTLVPPTPQVQRPVMPVAPAAPVQQMPAPQPQTPVNNKPEKKQKQPKEKKSKKKLWAILIPVIALIVAIAILVPTVIIPWWQGRNAEPIKRRTSSLAAGYNSSVALKADGMVYTAGLDDESTKEVKTWTEIVALDSSGYITAGIRKDGTVVFADKDKTEWNADTWTNIDKVSVGKYSVVGVKKDGTAVTESKNDAKIDVSTWKDIAYAAVSDNYAVGVKNDGGAVVAGDNGGMKAEIEKWTDIVSVSVSENVAVGLKSDGTVVVSVKDGTNYDFNVDDWKDIIAVSAGTSHVVGLKSDGTVVSAGDTSNGKLDVSTWEKIVDISAGNEHTLGLREDGTVTAVGNNDNGQCNVSEWKDILIPIWEEITEEKQTSSATENNPTFLEPTQAEWEELENLLSIFSFSGNISHGYKYDKDSSDAVLQFHDLFCFELGPVFYYWYFDDAEKNYQENGKWNNSYGADPLKKFDDKNPVYYKLPSKNVDWIISNIFNIQPSHNTVPINDNFSCYYYHGDSFYLSGGWGGYISPEYVIKTKNKTSNGMYEILANGYSETDENHPLTDIFNVTAGIKEVDGKRYWSFTKISYSMPNNNTETKETQTTKTETNKTNPTKDNATLFYEYIKKSKNLSPIGYPKVPFAESDEGIISALIKDFDKDGKEEMITASITEITDEYAYGVVFELYRIKNNVVTHCDSSEKFSAEMSGYFEVSMCAEYTNGKIMIYSDGVGFGGSTLSEQWISLSVKGDKLVKDNHFSEYYFYRYEIEEYEDILNKKTYSSTEEFMSAVKAAKFNTEAHTHYTGYETEAEYNNAVKGMKGNHIFVFGNDNSVYKDGGCYIYDNTNIRDHVK